LLNVNVVDSIALLVSSLTIFPSLIFSPEINVFPLNPSEYAVRLASFSEALIIAKASSFVKLFFPSTPVTVIDLLFLEYKLSIA